MKLPPATTWLTVGSLCLCSCTVPYFIGNVSDTEWSGSSDSTDADVAVTEAPTTDLGEASEAGAAASTVMDDGTSTEMSSLPAPDLPTFDVGNGDEDYCQDPAIDCDSDSEAFDHALGLNCAGGMASLAPLAIAGTPGSLKVVGQLGQDDTFAPRLGARALLLSTGVADHITLAPQALLDQTACSQIGLPCPGTDFPAPYDLETLPLPLQVTAIDCPPGQVPPGPGDCSNTVDEQWLGQPRLAHDYSEVRLQAEAPLTAIGLSLQAAFFTAEYPSRLPIGAYNDLLLVWLESEQWTGNIAVHADQKVAMAAGTLDWDHTPFDPPLAGFAFEEHAATDWTTFAAEVTPGETITLVLGIFDVNDGEVDSAVLLDDLRWTCAEPNLGPRHH